MNKIIKTIILLSLLLSLPSVCFAQKYDSRFKGYIDVAGLVSDTVSALRTELNSEIGDSIAAHIPSAFRDSANAMFDDSVVTVRANISDTTIALRDELHSDMSDTIQTQYNNAKVLSIATDTIQTLYTKAEVESMISDSLWNQEIPHAYLIAFDSSYVAPLTKDTWFGVSNNIGTFFKEVELDAGFTTLGDSLLLPRAGDYDGHHALNITGNKGSYQSRVVKNSTVLWQESKNIPASGDTISFNVPFYVYDGVVNDTVYAQVRNITDGDDLTFLGAIMKLFWIHP